MKALQQLGIAIASLFLVCAPAWANPALWVVKSPTATVYLFGTIHVLAKGTHWHYLALDRALMASDSLYVEENDSSHVNMRALVLKYGADPADREKLESLLKEYPAYRPYLTNAGRSYSALKPDDAARLSVAAEHAGLTNGAATLDAMKPGIAALALTAASTRRSGYEPRLGADEELEREFKAGGRPIHTFETAREQIEFFADMPLQLQLELLQSLLHKDTHDAIKTADLVRDWQTGDIDAIDDAVISVMRMYHPDLYQVLLVNRNRKWAGRIAELLKQHGTVFVAVGVAHLAGPDSVQVQLSILGLKPRRVR
ncbi:MAG TPA: TraB/GumN family protein [Rhodanobacteraceae bacterium]|nr:TraB/GumN family protein [Rhodanobacteraceae bacterium]